MGSIFVVPAHEQAPGATEPIYLVRVPGFSEDTGSLLTEQIFEAGPSRQEQSSSDLLIRLGPADPMLLPPGIADAAAAAVESPIPFGPLRLLRRQPRLPVIALLPGYLPLGDFVVHAHLPVRPLSVSLALAGPRRHLSWANRELRMLTKWGVRGSRTTSLIVFRQLEGAVLRWSRSPAAGPQQGRDIEAVVPPAEVWESHIHGDVGEVLPTLPKSISTMACHSRS